MYFVIYINEDGLHCWDVADKETLLAEIKEDEDEGTKWSFRENVPDDFHYQPEYTAIIIKGEIVVPKPVHRVIEYEIE